MKRFVIILSLLSVCLASTSGQTAADSISMKKVFGGYQFYKSGMRLNMNQLVSAMKPDEQAYKQIKSAQTNYAAAMVLSCAGGFMVGWPIGTAIGGGEPNWAMAGVGAGLIAVSIPITQSFNKKAKTAVSTYNRGLQTTSFRNRSELNLLMTTNGVGISLRF